MNFLSIFPSPDQIIVVPNPCMKLSFFVFLCFLYYVSGCGYVSTTDYLNHIESITISPVVIEDPDFTYQRSTGRLYDEIVRESITESFEKKWQDGNDSQLDIVVVDYDLRPINFNANNQPIQLQMKLTIDYTFTDRVRNKVIDRQDNYIQICALLISMYSCFVHFSPMFVNAV